MARGRESYEQQAFVQWCSLRPLTRLIFAIPNGGQRSKATAGILKAEGVRAGVPDLLLPVARSEAHGLFVEMKADGGAVSPAQRDLMEALVGQGYTCVVAYGVDMAIEAATMYLEGALRPGKYTFRRTAADRRMAA